MEDLSDPIQRVSEEAPQAQASETDGPDLGFLTPEMIDFDSARRLCLEVLRQAILDARASPKCPIKSEGLRKPKGQSSEAVNARRAWDVWNATDRAFREDMDASLSAKIFFLSGDFKLFAVAAGLDPDWVVRTHKDIFEALPSQKDIGG